MKKIFMVVWLCIFSLSLCADDGFSFDDLEEVEKSEQSLLLQMAKEQARAYNFSKAQSLIKEAENKAYSPDELSSAKKVLSNSQAKKRREDEERARQARLAEEKRQREMARRNAYIVDWGTDFQTGNSFWGRHGVKLSNGRKIYMWLEKETYGLKCYNLNIQGSFYGSGSLCADSIKSYSYWTASCEGSGGMFHVKGNQVDVVKAIVSRCGGY